MAKAPGHLFGQMLGNMLEEILSQELQNFCDKNGLFLDKKGARGKIRKTKKVSLLDIHGTSHDLDFVIEKGGTVDIYGRPVAFIEAAWRSKTKHSRAKAQEIQGALLPIAEKCHWNKPFLGVVLAGVFTAGALEQMKKLGFEVTLFPTDNIKNALLSVGIKIDFSDKTPDDDYQNAITLLNNLSSEQLVVLKQLILKNNKPFIDHFLVQLQATLDRQIDQIILIPLHGQQSEFGIVADAIKFVTNYREEGLRDGAFRKYEIIVRYTNKDKIDASFQDKEKAVAFLRYVAQGTAS